MLLTFQIQHMHMTHIVSGYLKCILLMSYKVELFYFGVKAYSRACANFWVSIRGKNENWATISSLPSSVSLPFLVYSEMPAPILSSIFFFFWWGFKYLWIAWSSFNLAGIPISKVVSLKREMGFGYWCLRHLKTMSYGEGRNGQAKDLYRWDSAASEYHEESITPAPSVVSLVTQFADRLPLDLCH